MSYKLVGKFGDTVAEGTKEQCEFALNAFEKYGYSNKVSVEESPSNLSENLRDKIINICVEEEININYSDPSFIREQLESTYDAMSDEDLIRLLGSIYSTEDDDEVTYSYNEAKAQLAIVGVLLKNG